MKNTIVGTAGHVDHGKTCLIKALTGMDTDRLKEEKQRGITIENGFADMICGDYNISIIDVPGHEKFVRNMLVGIGGIDLVLLVIGLDEGVMPQTREHFEILNMLRIRRGIIVYTKSDLVDDIEWKELVKDDVHEMTKGSFLENAAEIEVSSYTGQNIDKLRELIASTIDDSILKNCETALFRLPVDRVFTIDGFGTVVTGTLTEGSVSVGDEVEIYPEGKPVKVRSLQVHNEAVTSAFAGQRTALNLGGIKKEEIARGSVLSGKGAMEPSRMLDVELTLFADAEKEVKNGSRVHFYCGSSEALAKLVLLDRDVLERGQSCFAQLRFETPIAVKYADRFIIRFYSPMLTIGGGKILETTPSKHKRFDEAALATLEIKKSGNGKELCEALIRERSGQLIEADYLCRKLGMSAAECEGILEVLKNEGKVKRLSNAALVHTAYLSRAAEACLDILHDYHEKNRMSQGLGKEELKSALGRRLHIENKKMLEALLSELAAAELIRTDGKLAAAADFVLEFSPEAEKMKERILSFYRMRRFEMPTVDEVLEQEKDRANARHIIEAMEGSELVKLNHQYYIDKEAFDTALRELTDKIHRDGQITLAEFRDIIGTSRKYAMAILEYLDEAKITRKTDDVRVLRQA